MKRGPVLILISLLLAVFAAWVANNWVRSRSAAPQAAINTTQVVAAAIQIPFGVKIESRHLTTIELPTAVAPAGFFSVQDDVIGRLARTSMFPGEVILPGRLADANSGSALAAVVPKNRRAVTVRVDDVVGVGGFLLPGNRVDVLASRRVKEEMVTETILSNVKVLAVDQTASIDENKPVVVRAVTLEVTPAQAEILIKGKEAGTIQLTLRNPEDSSIVLTKREAPAAPKPKAAPRLPPRDPQVTVIRGTQVRQEK